jgi:hypothetical protein
MSRDLQQLWIGYSNPEYERPDGFYVDKNARNETKMRRYFTVIVAAPLGNSSQSASAWPQRAKQMANITW